MKIYVHKNGKSFGPYSPSQLRDCLVAKQFSMEDPACCDGKTWIRLADVPGISETPKANGAHVAKPSNEVLSTHKEEKIKTDMEERPRIKSRKKAFALAGISFALIACSAGSLLAFWSLKEKEGSQTDDQIGQRNDTYSGDKIPEFEKFDPRPAAKKIDDLIYANLKKNNLSPYEEISDEQFVRRVYLSIIGRIPTIAEADRFHESTSADKHSLLIRELLSNDAGYTAHHYQFWADLLRIPTRIDYTLFYREWIKDQIRVNTPYDELVRQLVSGHGLIFDNPAAAYYLRDAGMALDNMSNSVRIFLGTRLECAQCHDHPFDKWSQMDYFKMAAYTYDFDVRMGANKESNRQRIYRDFKDRKWGAYAEAAGFEDFPHIREESEIDEWFGRPYAPRYLEDNGLTKDQFREATVRAIAARKKAEAFDHPVSQSINMLYGHISHVQVRHHRDKPLQLPHDYQYDDGNPGDVVAPDTMFGPDIPIYEDPSERKNAYAEWLTSKKNPRFTQVIVNRLWKRAFGHGIFEPVDNLTDHTEISQPELLAYLEKLMRELDYDVRAFQSVLFHTRLFRREMHREDHSAGMKFHFAGPLLKRMSAEQIWDSITTLVLPEVDTHAPFRKKTLDRIARSEAIYQSLEGQPFEEVLPKIREAGAKRRAIRIDQTDYEKRISAAYASGDKELAKTLTAELKEKVRQMEKESRDLVFVGLKENSPASPTMMGTTMMGSSMESTSENTNERISKARPRKAPDGLNQNERKRWEERERLDLRRFRDVVREMARAVELDSPAKRGHFLRDFGQSDREVIENSSSHASVPQALYLLNSPLNIAIENPNSVLGEQLHSLVKPKDKIELVYRAMLSRKPTDKEVTRILSDYEKHGEETIGDLVWALLNSRQFIFIQ